MSKLFQKMYIGDPNKPDLTKEKVASESRFKLFLTVIQVRGVKLLSLNLLYSLFLIPTFFWTYFMLINLSSTQNFSMEFFVPYIYMYFPCFLIAMPGTLGFTNVLHRWANDEHAWVGSDFWDGIKKNWKQGLAVTVINYFVLLLLIYCTWWWHEMGKQDGIFSYLGYAYYVLAGVSFVYFMVHMYVFPMLVRYKLKLKDLYRYAFMLSFRCFLGTVVCLFACLFYLYAIILLFSVLPDPIFAMLLFAFLIVLPYLGIYVYMGSAFDKYVYLELRE